MFTARKFFLAALLVTTFSIAARPGTKAEVVPPRPVMKQVVGRIVRRYFRPARSKKVIYFAREGITKSWLPRIKGVRFVLLLRRQIADTEHKVYFFLKPELRDDVFYITFARGDGGCNGTGDVWTFGLHKAVATLKQTGLIWASRCQSEAYITRLLRSPVPDP